MRRCFTALCLRVLKDGTRLDGRFEGDRLVEGSAVLPDGRKFTGCFDPVHGFPLPDSVLEEDSDFYQGMFNAKWQRHGEGVALLADGTKYAGRFEADELVHGIVRIPDTNGDIVFVGTLKDELFVTGRMEHPDYVYEGEFQANQPHGTGKLTFTNGATQEGTFFRGNLHGDNCKMRLESGHLYTGTFRSGKITEGELRTPTYTYEGHFNEQGMAEGDGRAEHLTMHPRIIFSGHWKAGTLISGACHDEYGSPIDYRNDPDLQMKMGSTVEELAVDAACRDALQDKKQQWKEMNASYCADADRVETTTGKRPTKYELGYEAPVDVERDAIHLAALREDAATKVVHSRAHTASKQIDWTAEALEKTNAFGEAIDMKTAKVNMIRQHGMQETLRRNADEQLERFLASEAARDAADASPLDIDSNPRWGHLTPASSRKTVPTTTTAS